MKRRINILFTIALMACIPFVVVAAHATDVTSATSIQKGAIVLNQATNTFDAVISITNTGQVPLKALLNVLVSSSIDPIVGLPPDPGVAGKATLAGIDSNNNGVRDDVEIYIETTLTDSARHREALKQYARAIQHELLAQSRDAAIQASYEGIRTIECLQYLGKRRENLWKDIDARMLNTEQRLRAFDTFNDLVNGAVFTSLPNSAYRTACHFDVEALPN